MRPSSSPPTSPAMAALGCALGASGCWSSAEEAPGRRSGPCSHRQPSDDGRDHDHEDPAHHPDRRVRGRDLGVHRQPAGRDLRVRPSPMGRTARAPASRRATIRPCAHPSGCGVNRSWRMRSGPRLAGHRRHPRQGQTNWRVKKKWAAQRIALEGAGLGVRLFRIRNRAQRAAPGVRPEPLAGPPHRASNRARRRRRRPQTEGARDDRAKRDTDQRALRASAPRSRSARPRRPAGSGLAAASERERTGLRRPQAVPRAREASGGPARAVHPPDRSD